MRYGHIECANKACTARTVSNPHVKYVHTWSVPTRHDSLRMSSQTVMCIRHPGLRAQVQITSKLAVCRCCNRVDVRLVIGLW